MDVPTRLMAGLHLLKHMEGLSDEAVCARWVENPYFQYFCGEQFFRHKLPLDRSSMTRWRDRIGADKLELLLAETLRVALRTDAVTPQACKRVTLDTTVQTKAIDRVELGAVLGREAHVGEDVLLDMVHERRELGDRGSELVGDPAPLDLGVLGGLLGEGSGDEGRDDPAPVSAGVRQRVAGEVHAAALPGGIEHAGDRRLDAFVCIRDDELDAAQATPRERAQEVGPEYFGFRWTDGHR
jgi:hypothetical protein